MILAATTLARSAAPAVVDPTAPARRPALLTTDVARSSLAEKRYLRAVRRHPDAAVFVVEEQGRLVGRLSLAREVHPASRHVADLGLMVAAAQRRRGIGRALLEQAVAWARASGVTKLELHVFPWNEPAIALYEAFGFEREGYRKRQYLRGGKLDESGGIPRLRGPDVHHSTTTPWPPRRGSPAAPSVPSGRVSTAETPPK